MKSVGYYYDPVSFIMQKEPEGRGSFCMIKDIGSYIIIHYTSLTLL
jgi:hypothetical protein